MHVNWWTFLVFFLLFVFLHLVSPEVELFEAFDRKVFKTKKQRYATFDQHGILWVLENKKWIPHAAQNIGWVIEWQKQWHCVPQRGGKLHQAEHLQSGAKIDVRDLRDGEVPGLDWVENLMKYYNKQIFNIIV